MAYIGRPGQTETSAVATTETFTGDGGTTFTLSKSIRDNNASFLEVFVSNVQQQPAVSYSIVGGTTLTFAEAPGAGEPIYVIFRDYTAAPNFTVPDGAITESKLAALSVTSGKIAASSITNAKMAANAIAAANLQENSVTGDKLDVGAVTETKIVNASVTSAKLASNLVFNGTTTFLGGSLEKVNIQATAVPSTVTINNVDNAIVYYTGEADDNVAVTVNFTNLASVAVGNVATYAVIITNNVSNNSYISAVEVDGVAADVLKWQGGAPTGSANIDAYSFSVIKTAVSTYTVLAASNEFQ